MYSFISICRTRFAMAVDDARGPASGGHHDQDMGFFLDEAAIVRKFSRKITYVTKVCSKRLQK